MLYNIKSVAFFKKIMHSSKFTFYRHKLSIGFLCLWSLEHSGWSLGFPAYLDKGLSYEPGPGLLAQTPDINLLCVFGEVAQSVCFKQEFTKRVMESTEGM